MNAPVVPPPAGKGAGGKRRPHKTPKGRQIDPAALETAAANALAVYFDTTHGQLDSLTIRRRPRARASVAPWEAALGARVLIPTLDGSVEMTIRADLEEARRLGGHVQRPVRPARQVHDPEEVLGDLPAAHLGEGVEGAVGGLGSEHFQGGERDSLLGDQNVDLGEEGRPPPGGTRMLPVTAPSRVGFESEAAAPLKGS